jgi:hypothetical protein
MTTRIPLRSACASILLVSSLPILAAPSGIVIERAEMQDSTGARKTAGSDSKENSSASPLSAQAGQSGIPAKGRPGTAAASGPIHMKQTKELHVWVRNRLRTDQPETVVRYWICGRDMKTNKYVLLGGDEEVWKPGPAGTKECAKEFVSDVISSDYQQKSAFVNTIRPGMAGVGMVRPGMPMPAYPQAGRGLPYPAMQAPAPQTSGGVKIIGHAVQLIQNGKIVDENYIEPSLKAVVGSNGTTPGPKFEKSAESK